MDVFVQPSNCNADELIKPNRKAVPVQLVLSLALGLSAFVSFCILRPRWKSLYAARKRRRDDASTLPELPDSFLGWIPALIRIPEAKVLESAGLDAFVFLSFFKMGIKFLFVSFILASVILAPINNHFDQLPKWGWDDGDDSNETDSSNSWMYSATVDLNSNPWTAADKPKPVDTSYLWAYVVFVYVFSGLAFYFMVTETIKVIKIRQEYLGSQSTVTDRTIQLSGIPEDMRSEAKIKDFIETLQIGSVESVTICRNWKKLDELMEQREQTIRQLERYWISYAGSSGEPRPHYTASTTQANGDSEDDEDLEEAGEGDHLLAASDIDDKPRPKFRLWYGTLKLQSRKVDALDFFTEKLRKLDDAISEARNKEYEPTHLAFVTMDSVPACQMAVQAVLDASPGQFQTSLAPAPSDVIWQNTYQSSYSSMFRSWAITTFIFILTIFWSIPVAFLAGLVSLCSIRKVSPRFAETLSNHDIGRVLFQTGLPTIMISLLNVAVPYLYEYLSYKQGSVSRSHVELSLISKNFMFTFFNIFLVYSLFGTATQVWPVLKESLHDTTKIMIFLAQSIKQLPEFYMNFILLQGVGLFPFKLLEFGSVSLHPILKATAKTPRDHAEIEEPPLFTYGFYLPTALLVLILCIIYSVLPAGFMMLGFGLVYFLMGYFVYKYQLLYAMDNPQHATGRAWSMICYRIMIGLFIFQLAMASIISLGQGFEQAVLLLPLLPFTVWFSYYYARAYEPLIRFISLRSIRQPPRAGDSSADELAMESPVGFIRRRRSTIDEVRERGQKFANPNIYKPLPKPWYDSEPISEDGNNESQQDSTESSLSLGDTHIWRDNNEEAV